MVLTVNLSLDLLTSIETNDLSMDNTNISKYKIDYSKWDRLVDSDSDDDNNDVCNNEDRQRPQVTVLDQPTRVTFGGYGNNNNIQRSSNDDKIDYGNDEAITHDRGQLTVRDVRTESKVASSNAKPTDTTTDTDADVTVSSCSTNDNMFPLSWTENGTAVLFDSSDASTIDLEKNNLLCLEDNEGQTKSNEITEQQMQHEDTDNNVNVKPQVASKNNLQKEITPSLESKYHYIWSQDRMCVHIRIPLYNDQDDEPTITKKIKYNVTISNMLSYPNRHCATFTNDTEKSTLLVTATASVKTASTDATAKTIVLLNGSLSYPVYSPEDYDDNEVDWSIQEYTNTKTNTENVVSTHEHQKKLTFSKYILISLYKATPMINMTIWWKKCLTNESEEVQRNKDGGATSNNEAFQKAWDEAHRTFKDSIQSRQKYSL